VPMTLRSRSLLLAGFSHTYTDALLANQLVFAAKFQPHEPGAFLPRQKPDAERFCILTGARSAVVKSLSKECHNCFTIKLPPVCGWTTTAKMSTIPGFFGGPILLLRTHTVSGYRNSRRPPFLNVRRILPHQKHWNGSIELRGEWTRPNCIDQTPIAPCRGN
jgi:hypothetical protein